MRTRKQMEKRSKANQNQSNQKRRKHDAAAERIKMRKKKSQQGSTQMRRERRYEMNYAVSHSSSPGLLPDIADIVLSYCYHPLLQLWESIEYICQTIERMRRVRHGYTITSEEKTLDYYAHLLKGEGENTEKPLAVSSKRIAALEEAYRVKLSDPHFHLPAELKILWSVRDGVDRNRKWMDRARTVAQDDDDIDDDDEADDGQTCYQELFDCCLFPSISRVESFMKNSPSALQSRYVILTGLSLSSSEGTTQTYLDLPSGAFYQVQVDTQKLKTRVRNDRSHKITTNIQTRIIDEGIIVRINLQYRVISYQHLLSGVLAHLEHDPQGRAIISNFDQFRSEDRGYPSSSNTTISNSASSLSSSNSGSSSSRSSTNMKLPLSADVPRFSETQLNQLHSIIQSIVCEDIDYGYVKHDPAVNNAEDEEEVAGTSLAWRARIAWRAQQWTAYWDDEEVDE